MAGMAGHLPLYLSPSWRDWRGRQAPLSAYFAFQHVWFDRDRDKVGHQQDEVQRFLARLIPDTAWNPLYSRVLAFRTAVFPGAASERGRDRVQRWLTGRVSVYDASPEMLERAAMAMLEEVWSLADELLPGQLFRVIREEREIRAALAPFPLGDTKELRRGRERWHGGEISAELMGTLDADRMTEAMLRYPCPSLLDVRIEPMRVNGVEVRRAEQQIFDESGRQGHIVATGGNGGTSLLDRQDDLTRIAVAGRIRRLLEGAFHLQVQLSAQGGLRDGLTTALEREVNVPREVKEGAYNTVRQDDVTEGAALVRPRNSRAKGSEYTESALAERNSERLEMNRWDDLGGRPFDDAAGALAELSDVGETARMWPMPGGS